MNPIRDPRRVEYYAGLVREMMLTEPGEECEFDPAWIWTRDWKVVPTEEMGHLPQPDIPRLVTALRVAGCTHCVAVFNEPGYIQQLPLAMTTHPPPDMPICYLLSVDEADFQEFNRQLGPFRFLITADDRSWAISCTEWYNLFAAKPELLEAMLGKPIEQARLDYFRFASELAKQPDDPLLRVALRYATL